ncbi:conserved hypothetical protein, partial [Perkinsus marinus ATCC 50983]
AKNLNRARERSATNRDDPDMMKILSGGCIPDTYILPNEYAIFAEKFRKAGTSGNWWIMKPTNTAQGKGIFLFDKISQISEWKGHKI